MDGGGYSHQKSGGHHKFQGVYKQGGQEFINTRPPRFIKDKGKLQSHKLPIALNMGGPTKGSAWLALMRTSSVESLGNMPKIERVEVVGPKAKLDKLKVPQGPINFMLFMAAKK